MTNNHNALGFGFKFWFWNMFVCSNSIFLKDEWMNEDWNIIIWDAEHNLIEVYKD